MTFDLDTWRGVLIHVLAPSRASSKSRVWVHIRKTRTQQLLGRRWSTVAEKQTELETVNNWLSAKMLVAKVVGWRCDLEWGFLVGKAVTKYCGCSLNDVETVFLTAHWIGLAYGRPGLIMFVSDDMTPPRPSHVDVWPGNDDCPASCVAVSCPADPAFPSTLDPLRLPPGTVHPCYIGGDRLWVHSRRHNRFSDK